MRVVFQAMNEIREVNWKEELIVIFSTKDSKVRHRLYWLLRVKGIILKFYLNRDETKVVLHFSDQLWMSGSERIKWQTIKK